MLKEEAEIIKSILKDERNRSILNVCSSDEIFWKNHQPYIWNIVMTPLIERGNKIINLDMKSSKGVDIVEDCTNMQSIKNGSYDISLFTSGVEHIIDVNRALSEIHRILKYDGFMICSAPGVYPRHDDPIDTMLRLPNKEDWSNLLDKDWNIIEFIKTKPLPAKPSYKFDKLVFATIIKALPRK
ncbi:MAG: methyltransferase domain-containing protein [Candidatus Aureabacteria bacterium]|nr:methyltransferase domain-containing protein [Candidatus Auribacterota bacterium]